VYSPSNASAVTTLTALALLGEACICFMQSFAMPLFFASNAIYPISIMPSWLQVIAHVNPLTYVVNGLRTLMLAGGNVSFSSVGIDFAILLAITTVLILLGSWLYPGIVQ